MARRRDREARTARTTTPPNRLTRRTRRTGVDSGGPAVTNAENGYDYTGQDPINNYDLDGTTYTVGSDFSGTIWGAATAALAAYACIKTLCSGIGDTAWNLGHSALFNRADDDEVRNAVEQAKQEALAKAREAARGKSGRSGGAGAVKKKAGAELIRLGNTTPAGKLSDALKKAGRRLIRQGNADSHR